MKKIIILLLCCITINVNSQEIPDIFDYTIPRKYNLANIKIVGNERIDKNNIIGLSGLSVGSEIQIPGEKLSKAIQNIWKQKLFSDIKIKIEKIKDNNIYLVIEVKTRPTLSRYSFLGIKKSEADKLKEETSLKYGEIVTDQLLQNVTNQIKKFYIDKGRYDPSIRISQKPDSIFSNNSLRLFIYVSKGKRIRIGEIDITGNEVVKTKKINRLLKKTNENKLLNIFSSSKFIDDLYDEDKKTVIAYYNSLGYRDATITRDTVYFFKENLLKVELQIYEGNKYYFRDINWIGNTKYTSDHLSRVLGIQKGDEFNSELLQQKLSMSPTGIDISSLYMDDGYLFFNVKPVEVRIENDSIDVEIRIFEGPPAIINKIIISGNDKTSDHVIMRELRTRPGDKFSRSDIIRSQRELMQLDYFDPEKMNVIPTPNMEDGTVDIEYKLVEKPSDQLQLQGGWGAGQFVGSLGFMFSNYSMRKTFKLKEWKPLPMGDGQRLSFRFYSNGTRYSSINFSFTEPWFGGKKPNSFSFSIYHSIQSNGLRKDDPNRQDIQITGITIGLGKRLTFPDDYFIMNNSVTFQRYDINNYYSLFTFSNGHANSLSFRHVLSRNSIDQPIYPRRGSMFSLSLQWTPPVSVFSDIDYKTAEDDIKYKWIEYHKWKFDASWYINIVNKLVLNTKMQFGFLGNFNPDIGNAPFERFYIGGDGLSGYSIDGRELIALRGYKNNSLTAESATEVGATIFDKYTFELRYPISLNPSATIYALVFAEAGNSWLSFKDFNPFDAYRSAGAGIRIFMPMFGMLGFDWGYGFDTAPGYPERNGTEFHISIGQQF